MKLRPLSRWEQIWVLASLLWVAAVSFYASRQHDRDVQHLAFWADSIEWLINADPMVPISAKEMRAKVGDEAFIAAAASAYPKVELRQTLRRYEEDMARRARSEHPVLAFVLWMLVPPVLLYALGLGAARLGLLPERLREPGRPPLQA
jgi:hypothetical protein